MDLKDKNESKGMLGMVDSCISSWTEMTIADGEREEKIKLNAAQVRAGCVEHGRVLEANIKDLKAMTSDLMASFEALRKSESLLKEELEEARVHTHESQR